MRPGDRRRDDLTQALFGAGNPHLVMQVEVMLHFGLLLPLAYVMGVVLHFGLLGCGRRPRPTSWC